MFIDTHLHLIDRKRLSYPWLSDVLALDQDWTYKDYARTARRIGIDAALHMEVDVAPDQIDAETAFVRDLMGQPDSLIVGAISSARPESAEFAEWLDGVDRAAVRGVRRVLHVVPDELSTAPQFRESIRALGAADLPFDLCVLARQIGIATELVDSAPNTQFVLDHCGVPDIAGGAFDDWASAVTKIAQRPNVSAKISGITAYTGDDWSAETLRPYVEHVILAFGWDRVVWGSDSPVCTLQSSLDQWVAITHALMAGCSEGERAKLYSGNARRIWKL
ncbi:amidohydrolase family protein [Pseudoprimorskyibacter insulae]|uniref:Amidohydrolase-related domain-containing protein n=1 Tax=Pseudoprimorskyibacter insulae TaxID=1695997 RepID=A0A2R8AZX6_9RHOB|nr:amidohydrolase [Pseudoprimorskyibacter insulae]SPF81580.1 hypothetical protein PRI8871_03405 [Pseudoprimorskyibacter insulae]